MMTLTPKYVDLIPARLEERVLYICEQYETAVHHCCCGCGEKVVTPLTPTDWRIVGSGSRVSLYPSVGNWGLPCRSHYWIRDNRVVWAEPWSQEEIDASRAQDWEAKQRYYGSANRGDIPDYANTPADSTVREPEISTSLWLRLRNWFS